MTPRELLDLPLPDNDAGAKTVRGYLIALLAEVWNEGEGFSGKRPFGNSGWDYDLFIPMARAGAISGRFDPDGDLVECDEGAGRALVLAAISLLGDASGGESA